MKKTKKFFTVRKKLIATASSLAVALVMVVSSTYAWFTLSTAPEVKGISTSIGANGNLEMALLPSTGLSSIENGIVGNMTATEKNTYWGNLVDLSDPAYGLQNIVLKPARLNATGNKVSPASYLKTPVYGTDGRVNELEAKTTTAVYNGTNFVASTSTEYGVRAIGTANGRSAQQSALINAKAAIVTNKTLAKTAAQKAVTDYGNGVTNVAVTHAMANGAAESYTQADVNAIKGFATQLKVAYDYIDSALRQAIVAQATTLEDATTFGNVKNAIENKANKLSDLNTVENVTIPTGVSTLFATVETDMAALDTVIASMDALSGDTYTWAQISSGLGTLVDSDKILINDMTVAAALADKGALASSIMSKGLTVTAPTGSGVMADVADYAGDYSSSVTIAHLEYNGLALDNVAATLKTKTTVNPVYLDVASNAVATVEAAGQTDEAQPLTDMYGYALDFGFRTNAANSKLLLQTEEAQRIYGDSQNSNTQGSGSYFEFTSTDNTLMANNAIKLAELMGSLRVIFVDESNNILAVGATSRTVDVTKTEIKNEADEVTGYNVTVNSVAYTYGTDYVVNGSTVKAYINLYNFGWGNDGELVLLDKAEDAAIMALAQNTPAQLTTITYLDGDIVDNTMVSAFETINGSMNLQFASDATLVPMENSELRGETMNYTPYVYNSTFYFKGGDNNWYTKNGSAYKLVDDTDLVSNLNNATSGAKEIKTYTYNKGTAEAPDMADYYTTDKTVWYTLENGTFTQVTDSDLITNLNGSATPKA